jgi:hypothetical protein
VSERLGEPRVEEILPERVAEGAPEEIPQPAPARPNWLRLAYSVEFLLALLAILTLWSEVGGQGHLDMMPWYTKLLCVLASAWCCVRLSAGMVEHPRAWNRRTLAWLAGLVVMSIVMAGITFYYHLHEESDQPDSDDTTTAAMNTFAPQRLPSLY